MAANNYTTLCRGFATNAYYRGASVGGFNAVAEDGVFAAYCTFAINGAIQDPGGVPNRHYIWGNSEDAAFSGWSIELVQSGGELLLQAKVGNGAAYVTVQEPITGAAVAATGQVPASGVFNRLMMAMMWLDGTNLVLAVNGTVCGFTAFDEATLVASSLSASLGAGAAAVAANGATYADIASCGYSSDVTFAFGSQIGPTEAGSAFAAAQEAAGSGFMDDPSGLDWTHRYDFRTAAAGLGSSTLSKTAAGNRIASLPPAPQSIADVGGLGRSNLAAYSPIALNRGGVSTTNPALTQRKNMDWANVGTFFFTP